MNGNRSGIRPQGCTVEVRVHHDPDHDPRGEDCHDDDALRAWAADEWHHVGIEVTLTYRYGPWEASYHASLWGIEDEDYPRTISREEVLSYPNDHIIPELIAECIQQAKEAGIAVPTSWPSPRLEYLHANEEATASMGYQ